VDAARGGRDALELLRGGARVDAVLLDLAMPDMSGSEVLHALRCERPDLPVVIASGYRRDLDPERGVGLEQAFAFVQKPFDSDALVATLRRAMRSARRARTDAPGRPV
jgi:CheY-like chemotaxis protein